MREPYEERRRPSLFAYCEKCEVLYIGVAGKSVPHTCTTGRVVLDIWGNECREVDRTETVELPIKRARSVVRRIEHGD